MGLGVIVSVSCRWVCSLVVAHVVRFSYPQGPIKPQGPSAGCLSLPSLLLFFRLYTAINSWIRPLPLPVSLSLVLSSLSLSRFSWRSVDGVVGSSSVKLHERTAASNGTATATTTMTRQALADTMTSSCTYSSFEFVMSSFELTSSRHSIRTSNILDSSVHGVSGNLWKSKSTTRAEYTPVPLPTK